MGGSLFIIFVVFSGEERLHEKDASSDTEVRSIGTMTFKID